MLSRVADSLYWMSRYLERADHVARQLDVHLTIVPEQAVNVAGRRRDRLVTRLVAKDYVLQEVTSDYELARLLTLEHENSNSIVRCIAGARENARQVREEINSQMWEQINQLYLSMQNTHIDDLWQGQPHRFYHSVNQGVYLFQGIADSRITRDQGWQFVQLGRYLERALQTAGAVNFDFRELYSSDLAADASDQHTYLDWVGLLRGCAAYEAYSKVYTANVQPQHIVEFLLLNPAFPYSVHFAINAIRQALEQIGEATETAKSSRVYRLAGRLQAMLDYAQMDEILDSGLGSFLEDIQTRCMEIHNAIYQTYITYSIEEKLAL